MCPHSRSFHIHRQPMCPITVHDLRIYSWARSRSSTIKSINDLKHLEEVVNQSVYLFPRFESNNDCKANFYLQIAKDLSEPLALLNLELASRKKNKKNKKIEKNRLWTSGGHPLPPIPPGFFFPRETVISHPPSLSLSPSLPLSLSPPQMHLAQLSTSTDPFGHLPVVKTSSSLDRQPFGHQSLLPFFTSSTRPLLTFLSHQTSLFLSIVSSLLTLLLLSLLLLLLLLPFSI
ncbi:expressed protein [Phakopsora pachyrhizi]|uniref:Expressed protein n=1 Tax=Phakopsora pachyrhizi TaxID=170000 RepID=A0AAV0AQT1_PHAPC|nr:expressed protein [Phakopsora pachyrhizi]